MQAIFNKITHRHDGETMYPKFEAEEIPGIARLVCRSLLKHETDNEVRLLVGTAAAESSLQHRRQRGGGPARGLWQMEPATAHDIFKNYLIHRPRRYAKLMALMLCMSDVPIWTPALIDLETHLEHNDIFACAMCRIHYLRVPEAIPETVEQQARYWKQYYNTPLGGGTQGHYVAAWNACECERLIAEDSEGGD